MNPFRHLLACAIGGVAFALVATAQTATRAFDFGDHSSTTLTSKAWAALEAKDAEAVVAYTGKCIELYRTAALEQQTALTAPPPTAEPEKVHANWALNDVGTCHFILGQSLERQDKAKEALAAYTFLVEKLAYAQCWDTKGWFWSPADAAKGRVKALEFEAAQM